LLINKKVCLFAIFLAFIVTLLSVSPLLVNDFVNDSLRSDSGGFSSPTNQFHSLAVLPTGNPEAEDDFYTIDEDTSLIVPMPGVLENDHDVNNDPLAAMLDTLPSHGSLNFFEVGSFTYTPELDFFGDDSFTYHANDGALDSNIATVTITVNPVNDAPIITIVYIGDATDANPGYWTVTVEDPESGILTVTVEIDGILVGTLPGDYAVPNYLGLHTIRVNATDAGDVISIEAQDFSTLSETVTIIDDDTTGPQVTIVHSGGTTDSDSGVWTITVSDPESGIAALSIEIDGEIVGTTAGDYAVPATEGTHTITVTAYDGDLDRGELDQEMSVESASITISGEAKPGWVTGGGWIIDANGNKGHFAFVVKLKPNGDLSGIFLYSFKDGKWITMVTSTELLELVIDGNHAYFEATCSIMKINLHKCKVQVREDNYVVRVDVWDNPGRHAKNIFQIRIYDPSGQVWYEAGYDPIGYVHGAIVIHEYKRMKNYHCHHEYKRMKNCHCHHGRW